MDRGSDPCHVLQHIEGRRSIFKHNTQEIRNEQVITQCTHFIQLETNEWSQPIIQSIPGSVNTTCPIGKIPFLEQENHLEPLTVND